jgi:hypothetical protein
MTCREIQDLLPGYWENHLSEEEKGLIANHLTICSLCRQSLIDLKETENLLNHLEEVEPPPFFEQRIMSRIREDAGKKKSLFRRIFFPTHIKIPLQVMATVLIAVLAVYLYQKNEPEIRPMIPFSTPPIEQPQKGLHEAESPQPAKPPYKIIKPEPGKSDQLSKAPLPSSPGGGGAFPPKDQSQFAPPPPVTSRGGVGDSAESARPKEDEKSASLKLGASIGALKEKEDYAQKPAMSQPRFEAQEPSRTGDVPGKEGKKKSEVADKGMVEKKTLLKSSPAPAGTARADKEYSRTIDLNLQVKDMDQAFSHLENLLNKAGARVIERTASRDRGFLKVEMTYSNFTSIPNQLEEIGRVDFNKESPFSASDRVTLLIHISRFP